jgi:hydrogenase expression/formation protein HypE
MTRVGKLDRETLVKDVLRHFKTTRKELLLGPVFGVDVAVIKCPSGYLITSTDPITGEVDDIGWYSVHVSCNDVATSGNRPQFVEVVIMMGEGEGEERAAEISKGIARAAKQVRVDVVGGHTERTAGLAHSIVVTTAFAFADGYVTAAGAKEGDSIVLTKTVGIEGTSILASMLEGRLSALPRRRVNEGKRLSRLMSVVDEGEAAFREGGVHAMHDPTEGGILGGLYEMGVGSGLGFTIEEPKVPLAESTREITQALGVDPLRLIASGSMLMAVAPRRVAGVLRSVKAVGVDATVVGRFGEGERVVVRTDGSRERVDETVLDELWRIIGERSQRPKRR